jgi:hypothetical protein
VREREYITVQGRQADWLEKKVFNSIIRAAIACYNVVGIVRLSLIGPPFCKGGGGEGKGREGNNSACMKRGYVDDELAGSLAS